MTDFFMECVIPTIIGVMILITVILLGYMVYDELVAETFSLRKDAWTCTRSHAEISTTVLPIGKIMIPQTSTIDVCDQWSSK